MALKKGRELKTDVQWGFDVIIPKKFQKAFLREMEKNGWIHDTSIDPPDEEVVCLIPRYKFVTLENGKYCSQYDKITGKTFGLYFYLFDT